MKKVSIMMMTYNSIDNLRKTFKSIEQQDYPNIELVISDGGSKDGTVELIKQFSESSSFDVKWVSERDNGLYDALNKDIKMATGDYLLVFNDQFIDNSAITKLVKAIESEHSDGVHADLIYADEDKVKRFWHMAKGNIRWGWTPGHPTLMLKKEIYDKYGMYSEQYKIASDYEFMVRVLKNKEVKLAYVPDVLVRMYYGGTSTSSMSSYYVSVTESHLALADNGIRCAWLIGILRSFRVLLQFLCIGKAERIWKEYNKG